MWKRSTFCATNACVEVKVGAGFVYIRKSEGANSFAFTHREWTAFLEGAKAGEFDLPEAERV